MTMEVVFIDGEGLPEHIGRMEISEATIDLVEEQLPSSLLSPIPIIILN